MIGHWFGFRLGFQKADDTRTEREVERHMNKAREIHDAIDTDAARKADGPTEEDSRKPVESQAQD